MTELEIVNDMLAAVGERPVISLDAGHPLVHMARNKLSMCNATVQTQLPWWFNTYTEEFNKDAEGYTRVPLHTLKVVPKKSRERVTVRAGKLYSVTRRTYDFSGITLSVTVTVDYDELPTTIADYLRAYAVAEFTRDRQEEYNIRRERDAAVQYAYARAHSEHMSVIKANRSDAPSVMSVLSRTNPYRI